jgi:hypothetical protein
MKKEYEAPDIYVEEYALEQIVGDLCVGPIGSVGGGIE